VPQITLYLDEETDAKARAAAKLAGSRPDFPLRGADGETVDVPRVSLE
jgi:hypothetical protein